MNKMNILISQPKDTSLDKVRVYYREGVSQEGLYAEENKIYEGPIADVLYEEYNEKTLFRIAIEYFNDEGKTARSIPRAPQMRVNDLGPWAYCSKDPFFYGDEIIGLMETRDEYFPSKMRVFNYHHQRVASIATAVAGLPVSNFPTLWPHAETNHLMVDGEIYSLYNYPSMYNLSTTQLESMKADMDANPEKYRIDINGFIWQFKFMNRKIFNALATNYNAIYGLAPLFPKPAALARLLPYNGTSNVITSYYSRSGIWVDEVEVEGVKTDVWNRWASQEFNAELGTYTPNGDTTVSAINSTSTQWPFVLHYIGRADA